MAIRQIFKNDAECLYKKCRPVERFDKKLSDLIDDMADTMYEADGVGLAAPQVGILRLSFPGKQGYVVRPNRVRVQARDRKGDLYEYEGEELFARAILHENDHLDGLIYTGLVTDPPEGYKEEELEYTEPEDDTEEDK